MSSIFTAIRNFFNAETSLYAHRHTTVESVAEEQGIDIESIRQATRATLIREGRIAAIHQLRGRFHLPLSVVWRFVDRLDTGQD